MTLVNNIASSLVTDTLFVL